MSKILMDKINNILNIDKEKEYINFSLQEKDKYINLSSISEEKKLNDFVDDASSEIRFSFNINYETIIKQAMSYTNYNDLNDYLKSLNIDYQYEPKYAVEKKPKGKKQKEDNKYLKEEDSLLINEEFFYYKKMIAKKIKDILLNEVSWFEQMTKRSKKAFIETGKNLLRIGFDFIQGHINEQYIEAPLFLIDLEIEIDENVVVLTKKSKRKINEKLIIFILNQLDINYKEWDFNQIKTKDDFIKLIEPILEYQIEYVDNVDLSNEQNELVTYRTLKYISNQFYLGLFDIEAGKIKEDFIELMNNNVVLFKDKMKNDHEYYMNEEFLNNALIQINRPLNIYQKYALRSAINENTLIYGPPGTGKSEIITSIVANLLMNKNSILVVSEKEAALEVIKRRLSKLSIFAFYLKDIEDENTFYEQIEQISYLIGSFYNKGKDNFDLIKSYRENVRVIDYNEEIDEFRELLQEDIDFSLEKDSRNNDYRDYLLSIKEVENFIKYNKNGVNEFWNEYQNKFVKLQSATEFISKVAEFNWFREKYELTEDDTNKYDQMRQEFNRFLAEKDLIGFRIDSFTDLREKIDRLNSFLNKNMLLRDRDFMQVLSEDFSFLEKNYNVWKNIDLMLQESKVKNQEVVKRFLIKNASRHEKFLSKYILCSPIAAENLLIRYYSRSEISTSKMMFKPKIDKEVLKILVPLIQEFEKIKLFKSNAYLNQLIKEDISLFSPIIIYFFNNETLLKKSFIEFYNQQIINFDQRIIHQYYKYRVNQIERELININVYLTEKLNNNKHIIDRDIPRLVTTYLNNNANFILNIDEALQQTYLKHIKFILSNSSNDIQEKVEKMFRVVRMEVKPKINDFINEFLDCLRIIFPIWISKPELISFYLPNKKELFDIGIFDEASQMFLEKAYPMIYRCKQIIILGDDKQLKPERIAFNELKYDPDYRPLVKEIEFDLSESLLDRAKVSYWNTYSLKNHYRSRSKELIEFSNTHFYDAKLVFSTLNSVHETPLEVHTNDKNKAELDGINKDEAKLVIARLLKEEKHFKKIIIICFSKRQKEYIYNQIEKLANADISARIKNKTIVVGDLESIQGDEGDLVIISVAYSKNSQDYGFLSKPRGQNYLNVAITRAKTKMIIYKSLKANDIKVIPNDINKSILIFKKWIDYLDLKNAITNSKKQSSKTKLTSKNTKPILVADDNISSFKKDVFQSIVNDERFKGLNLIQNHSIGSIVIDLAFYSNSIEEIDLVVILDDWKKNLTIQNWFEDIDKEEYLRSREYQLIRIREQDWLKDKETIISYIERNLKSKIYKNADESVTKKRLKTTSSKKRPKSGKKGKK